MEKQIRPCHSIHCRHYDLADGMMCEVEAERIAARPAPVYRDVSYVVDQFGTVKLQNQIRVY